MRMNLVLAVGAALAVAAPSASAQMASAAATATQFDAQKTVADIRRIIAANYVLPEMRSKLDEALAAGLASGRYKVTDPAVLAERINADFTAVAHDKHLNLVYDPEGQADLTSRPAGSLSDDGPPTAVDIREAVANNHGIAKLELLPGNVRYMDLHQFRWVGAKTEAAYDDAVRFLRDGDAIIIDLRNNHGGSPEAVRYLVSHFLEANRPLVTFHMGASRVDKFTTLAKLPAGRLTGKPLYVLTGPMTASAAEEFTGHVAGFRLGELIGSTTAGAGFRNSFFPVAGGYVISVSVGRAVLASTGKDWEGVGIAPTTTIDPEKALDLAEVHAWRALAAKASGDDKRMLEANAALLDAKLNPVATALPLTRYAGTYGERLLTVVGNGLLWQRANGPKLQLVAIGPNEFSFDGDPLSRVTFSVAGSNVTGFKMVRADGSTIEAQRNN